MTYLMGGGIGVTPMIAMAHELHAQGAGFSLHYSAKTRQTAGFVAALAEVPWADRVSLHISNEGTRADLETVLPDYAPGAHVYVCGPDAYMQSVLETAERKQYPDETRHWEYFSVPETPDYENTAFTVKLAKSGLELLVPADKTAADVLNENGVHVDIKCSDGLCGVCKCGVLGGAVEHRDFVLSKSQQQNSIILCQSRALDEDGLIELDL